LREQMDEAPSYDGGAEMAEVIQAGVDAMKAAISEFRSVLELIGSERDAPEDEFLDATDGRLLLRHAVNLTTRGKVDAEDTAFPDLPQTSQWTWATVRIALTELSEASGKSVSAILGVLHKETLERYDSTRATLETGLRTLEANYILHLDGMNLLTHYHDRLVGRVGKWLSLFGQAKADRLGLTHLEPDQGANGDRE
jgi:hypothetical protein